MQYRFCNAQVQVLVFVKANDLDALAIAIARSLQIGRGRHLDPQAGTAKDAQQAASSPNP